MNFQKILKPQFIPTDLKSVYACTAIAAFSTGLLIVGSAFRNRPLTLTGLLCIFPSSVIALTRLETEERYNLALDNREVALTVHEQRLTDERDRLYQALDKERQDSLEVQAAIEAELQKWADNLKAEYEQALELEQQNFLMAQSTIQQLQADLNKIWANLPTGIRPIDSAARLIQQTLANYGAFLRFETSQEIPKFYIFWFEFSDGCTISDVKKAAEQLPALHKGVETTPELIFSDGLVEMRVALTADTAQPNLLLSEDGSSISIDPPPTNWLREIIKQSYHFFINGGTGSGKSTFINNLTNCKVDLLFEENNELVNLFYIDPKFPDTTWELNGSEVLPQFQNYDLAPPNEAIVCKEYEGTAQEGMILMQKDVLNRLNVAASAKRRKQKLPERVPAFYVIDEAEDIFGVSSDQWDLIYSDDLYPDSITDGKEFQKVLRNALKSTTRIGRSTRVSVAVIGQSWLPSDYGYRITNLSNSTLCFLGYRNARYGIRSVTTAGQERKHLNAQLNAMEKAAETDPQYRYIGLFKSPSQSPFLAPLPPPNAFQTYNAKYGIVDEKFKEEISKVDLNAAPFTDVLNVQLEGSEGSDEGSIYDAVNARTVECTSVQRSEPIGVPNLAQELSIAVENVLNVLYFLENNRGKADTIEAVWKVKKGGSDKYKQASQYYDKIKEYYTHLHHE